MSKKMRILYTCQHNRGRGQRVEAYLKQFFGGNFEVGSAGLDSANCFKPPAADRKKKQFCRPWHCRW